MIARTRVKSSPAFQQAIAILTATRAKTPAAGAALLLDEHRAGSDELRDAIVLALFGELRLLRERIALSAPAQVDELAMQVPA